MQTGNVVEGAIRGDDRRKSVPERRRGVDRVPTADVIRVPDQVKGRLQDGTVEVVQHAQRGDVPRLPDRRAAIATPRPMKYELLHHLHARVKLEVARAGGLDDAPTAGPQRVIGTHRVGQDRRIHQAWGAGHGSLPTSSCSSADFVVAQSSAGDWADSTACRSRCAAADRPDVEPER